MKSRVELTIEGSKTNAAKHAIRQAQELKAIIKQMRENQEWPAKIKEIEAKGLFEIKQDLLLNTQKEKDRISARISQLEKDYAKNLKENPVNYDSLYAKYSGMSDKELHIESMKMIANPKGHNPVVADYLSAELRNRGIDTHSVLRDKLIENDYTKPWTHSEEGQALQREANFYEHAKPGQFLIEGMTQGGKAGIMAADVEGLFNELQ